MVPYCWALFAFVVLARLVSLFSFAVLARRHRLAGVSWLAFPQKLRRLTTARILFPGDSARAQVAHRAELAASGQQDEAILVLGALALAAWTQLYAAAGTTSAAAALPDITRQLLVVGVALLLLGPLTFRGRGSHLTYMGRQMARYLGFIAVALSVDAAFPNVFGLAGTVLAAIAGAVVCLRDGLIVWDDISWQLRVIRSPTGIA